MLGVDRDSEQVAHIYDERNPAVKHMIRQVISVARNKGKYIGICGQAPSDHPVRLGQLDVVEETVSLTLIFCGRTFAIFWWRPALAAFR